MFGMFLTLKIRDPHVHTHTHTHTHIETSLLESLCWHTHGERGCRVMWCSRTRGQRNQVQHQMKSFTVVMATSPWCGWWGLMLDAQRQSGRDRVGSRKSDRQRQRWMARETRKEERGERERERVIERWGQRKSKLVWSGVCAFYPPTKCLLSSSECVVILTSPVCLQTSRFNTCKCSYLDAITLQAYMLSETVCMYVPACMCVC